MSAATDIIQAIGSTVSAIATVATAYVAWRAAYAWRFTLREQNADRVIVAGSEYISTLGRLRTAGLRQNWQMFWGEYDAAHRGLTSFNTILISTNRYYKSFPVMPIDEFRRDMGEIERMAVAISEAGQSHGAGTDAISELSQQMNNKSNRLVIEAQRCIDCLTSYFAKFAK